MEPKKSSAHHQRIELSLPAAKCGMEWLLFWLQVPDLRCILMSLFSEVKVVKKHIICPCKVYNAFTLTHASLRNEDGIPRAKKRELILHSAEELYVEAQTFRNRQTMMRHQSYVWTPVDGEYTRMQWQVGSFNASSLWDNVTSTYHCDVMWCYILDTWYSLPETSLGDIEDANLSLHSCVFNVRKSSQL